MPAIHHIAFRCKDRLAQEDFYVRHFGFKRCRVFNHGQPDEFVMIKLGDCRMEFFSSTEEQAQSHGCEQDIGFRHLAFTVDSLEKKIEELRADGIEPDPIIVCDNFLEGLRICFFNDPEGNSIELMEGWKDDENPPVR